PTRFRTDESAERVGELLVEKDCALHGLLPVAEVQALVFRVRVGVRILDTDEERGHAAELFRERLDEGDRPATPDRHRALAVSLFERAKRGLKCRMARVGVPPARSMVGLDAALETPRG